MRRKTKAAREIDSHRELNRQIAMLRMECKREREREQARELQFEREIEQVRPMLIALHKEIDGLKAEIKSYKQRLVDLLSDDQREHARITGCEEDEYAIQLIRLCNEKINELSALTYRGEYR